ncbi:hypothetical protein GCM10010236_75260 [Streptomyces eurythermus]|nr:hypothetical protein GCM10010236_75260 [Streptomyces eurythermus]
MASGPRITDPDVRFEREAEARIFGAGGLPAQDSPLWEMTADTNVASAVGGRLGGAARSRHLRRWALSAARDGGLHTPAPSAPAAGGLSFGTSRAGQRAGTRFAVTTGHIWPVE